MCFVSLHLFFAQNVPSVLAQNIQTFSQRPDTAEINTNWQSFQTGQCQMEWKRGGQYKSELKRWPVCGIIKWTTCGHNIKAVPTTGPGTIKMCVMLP